MTAHEQAEIERKYDVDVDAAATVPVPALAAVDGIPSARFREPVTLTAVYFDTERLDLAAHLIVLRRREGGADEGWHIKKPAREGRTELHWPIGRRSDDGEIPDAVLEPVRAIVRDRALTPLARITTVRTAVHLLDDRGEAVAELADDEVSAVDVRGGESRSWREWEVELLPAAPKTRKARTRLLDAIEQVLVAAGARPSASAAKLAQALGVDSLTQVTPTATAAPVPAHGRQAGEDAPSAASVVAWALGRLAAELEDMDSGVRADRPHAVHRMRTAVRGLRSALATYRNLFDREAGDALRDGLQWLGAALGEARDAEVRGKRAAKELHALPAHRSDVAVRTRLVDGARGEYAEAQERARLAMTSPTYYRLLDALDDFVDNPPLTALAAAPAAGVVRKALLADVQRLRERADAALAAPASRRETALHEARKAARRLRHATEAVTVGGAPGFGKAYRKVAAAARPIEKSLGEHRDRMLFAEHLETSANRAHDEGEETFVYGLLIGGEPPRDDAELSGLAAAVRRIERRAQAL
jgi:CHAD domain-containing protein